MKDRIRQLLEAEKLSSSAFADIISVQRSSISHILSGRNKPSLDFLEKLLNKFQNVNSEWLILGKEPMYKSGQADLFNSNYDTNVPEKAIKTGANDDVTNVNISAISAKSPEPEKLPGKLCKTVKIVNFYDDNTFDEFFPKRN